MYQYSPVRSLKSDLEIASRNPDQKTAVNDLLDKFLRLENLASQIYTLFCTTGCYGRREDMITHGDCLANLALSDPSKSRPMHQAVLTLITNPEASTLSAEHQFNIGAYLLILAEKNSNLLDTCRDESVNFLQAAILKATSDQMADSTFPLRHNLILALAKFSKQGDSNLKAFWEALYRDNDEPDYQLAYTGIRRTDTAAAIRMIPAHLKRVGMGSADYDVRALNYSLALWSYAHGPEREDLKDVMSKLTTEDQRLVVGGLRRQEVKDADIFRIFGIDVEALS